MKLLAWQSKFDPLSKVEQFRIHGLISGSTLLK